MITLKMPAVISGDGDEADALTGDREAAPGTARAGVDAHRPGLVLDARRLRPAAHHREVDEVDDVGPLVEDDLVGEVARAGEVPVHVPLDDPLAIRSDP